MYSLEEIQKAQPKWFSENNKRFFGDLRYFTGEGGVSKHTYLIRLTEAWTDMLGGERQKHYRVNPIDQDTLKIEPVLDIIFPVKQAVSDWLKEN